VVIINDKKNAFGLATYEHNHNSIATNSISLDTDLRAAPHGMWLIIKVVTNYVQNIGCTSNKCIVSGLKSFKEFTFEVLTMIIDIIERSKHLMVPYNASVLCEAL